MPISYSIRREGKRSLITSKIVKENPYTSTKVKKLLNIATKISYKENLIQFFEKHNSNGI